MFKFLLISLVFHHLILVNGFNKHVDDNDFAEFEEFDDEFVGRKQVNSKLPGKNPKPPVVEPREAEIPRIIDEDLDEAEVDVEDDNEKVIELKEEEVRSRRNPSMDEEDEAIIQVIFNSFFYYFLF